MSKKFLGIFSKKPLIWFHYVLLTGVLFGAFFLAVKFGLVNQYQPLPTKLWLELFGWYFLFISIGDQLIHAVLRVD